MLCARSVYVYAERTRVFFNSLFYFLNLAVFYIVIVTGKNVYAFQFALGYAVVAYNSDFFYFVAEEINANGQRQVYGKNYKHVAAHRKFALLLHRFFTLISQSNKLFHNLGKVVFLFFFKREKVYFVGH